MAETAFGDALRYAFSGGRDKAFATHDQVVRGGTSPKGDKPSRTGFDAKYNAATKELGDKLNANESAWSEADNSDPDLPYYRGQS